MSNPASLFSTTHWSMVVAAGDAASPQAREALERLCQSYWYPLYAYVRRRGRSAHDAQDLTQSFFLQLLEHGYLSRADPRKGRFRTFMVVALNHFLINEWHRATTQKRGGDKEMLSWDRVGAEDRYSAEPYSAQNPESAAGAYTYSANAGPSTIDSFTFKVNDGALDSNFASIAITITGNQPPVASDATITTTEEKSISGVLRASDPEGARLIFSLATNGAKGTATLTDPGTGRFTYAHERVEFGDSARVVVAGAFQRVKTIRLLVRSSRAGKHVPQLNAVQQHRRRCSSVRDRTI